MQCFKHHIMYTFCNLLPRTPGSSEQPESSTTVPLSSMGLSTARQVSTWPTAFLEDITASLVMLVT